MFMGLFCVTLVLVKTKKRRKYHVFGVCFLHIIYTFLRICRLCRFYRTAAFTIIATHAFPDICLCISCLCSCVRPCDRVTPCKNVFVLLQLVQQFCILKSWCFQVHSIPECKRRIDTLFSPNTVREHGNTTVNSIRGQRCPWVEMVSLKLSDLYDSVVISDIHDDGQCRVRVPSS
jgi:hypothetical protein